LATGRSASLDHESGTLYLLLFVTQTRPCASGNSRKRFSLSDGHGASGVELATLNGFTHFIIIIIIIIKHKIPTTARSGWFL